MNAQPCIGRTSALRLLALVGGLLLCRAGYALETASTANSSGTASGSSAFVQEEPAKDAQKPKLVITPELAQCTLEIGRQILKPIHTASPWYREEPVGDRRIRLSKNQVIAIRAADRQPIWSAKSAEAQHLHWLTSDDERAYLVGYEVDSEGRFLRYAAPPRVRRLDLKTGRWLPDLPVEAPKDRKAQGILAVLARDAYVMVLCALVKAGAGADQEMPVSDYQVTCFRDGKATPRWSKSFPATRERPGPGVYLWATRTPDYATSALNHLAWLGDALLVCPEAVQPLFCLNPDTGTKIWQLDRPWEFERGFIGPSVWSHYLGRFRLEQTFGEKPKETARARQDFDKQFTCALIGGPVIVPFSPEHNTDEYRIFLAVSKGPPGHLSGYISDCILYEFDKQGEPVSLLKLPQMVSGSQFRILKGGLAWKCQNESFFKVVPSPHRRGIGMGPGGPDLLTRMPWFRQLTPPHPDGWLVADRGGDPLAFSETYAFCLPAGGYVGHQNKSTYHFPLAALDLEAGVEHALLLHAPFKGELPRPKTDYSQTQSADSRQVVHTFGPYVLGVTGLRVDSKALEITLGMENWSAVLTFDLGKSDLLRAVVLPEGPDPVKAWLAALGDVNKKDERGSTPLKDAAHRDDPRYVKALLAAGANPRAPAEGGWTALMTATAYGTAESLQLLIDAGADVNVRDTKNGGQTVLMWAARSGRQSKRKVQALLKAGADLKATTPDSGWNVLLSAASAGDLPTVELLLEAGLDVSYRSTEGETALMVAASSARANSGANLLSVLLKAGADVNARDNKSMTALMHAADSSCPLEVLRMLLESGADSQLRDKDGRTALDLARASNSFGADEKSELLQATKRH